MASVYLGYHNTGTSPDYGVVAANTQRAYVPEPLTKTVIFYAAGARAGRVGSSTPTSRMGIGNTTNNEATGAPDTRITYTSPQSFSTQMLDGTGGAVIEANLAAPFVAQADVAYALVLTAANYALGHGMVQSAAYTGKTNYNFYDRANGSSTPTNPIGGSGHSEGHMALWAVGEVNVQPDKPTGLSPLGTLASTDLTPVMLASFSDPNETLANGVAFDKMNKFQIQVRRKSDLTMFWDFTGNATSAEQAARQYSRNYAGTTLVAGVTYQQRVRMSDQAGAWSVWTDWTLGDFTINSGGTVTVSGATPTGKQNSQTPGPFTATWNHPSPLNADRAIVRVLDKNGGVVQTMSQGSPFTLSPSVANAGTISVPWANTGFTALARSADQLYYQIQARDTATAWSPWSASVPFTINATPTTPSNLSPSGSSTQTSAVKLSMSLSDPDASDPTSGLVGSIQILRADGTTVTRTPTYNATTGKHEYQTVIGTNEVQRLTRAGTISGGTFTLTVPANVRGAQSTTAAINWNDPAATIQSKIEALANVGAGRVLVTGGPVSTTNVDITFLMELSATDLSQVTVTSSLTGGGTLTPSTVTAGVNGDWAGFQTIQWRGNASDGVSTSAYSPYAVFQYVAGPAVTVTAPADEATVTTASYRFTWTVPSGGPQAKYQLTLVEVDGSDVAVPGGDTYDSGLITSTNLFHDIPTTVFRNGKRYSGVVAVTNATPVTGSSQSFQFTVTYTAPEAITGVTATPVALWCASGTDAILLNFNPTLRAADFWNQYDIWRTPLGPAQTAGVGSIAEISETVGQRVLMQTISNPAQTSWVDPHPSSGVLYLYEVEQVIKTGQDSLRSASATATASIAIPHIVMTVAKDPESYGFEFRNKAGSGAFLTSKLAQDVKKNVPVGGRKARSVASPFLSWDDSGTFEVVSDKYKTADQQLRDLNALVELGIRTLCLRDFTGLKRFVTLADLSIVRYSANRYQVSVGFTEEWFVEGESV